MSRRALVWLWPLFALGTGTVVVTAFWPMVLSQIFVRGPYVPHGVCILWERDLILLHILSDSLIGLSYLAIATTLGLLVFTLQAALPFRWMFLAFGGFIFFCGMTHFLAILLLWEPYYWLDGVVKALTAAASLTTAVIVPFQIPRVRRLVRNALAADEHRRERDKLYDRQQAAVTQLQEALVSKERDLLTLLEQLRQNEAYFRLALQGSPMAVFLTDINLRYRWAYNLPPPLGANTMAGEPDDKLPEAETATPLLSLKRRALSELRELREDITLIVDGDPLTYDVRVQPELDEGGIAVGVIGAAVDVTARKQLEARLFQSQKLESIGRLAGGIAHDFNNLLTVILGNLELARESLPAGHVALDDLHIVSGAAERAARLTRQLLTFARRQSLAPQLIDLNVLVRGMRPMLEQFVGEQIDLRLGLRDDPLTVQIDPIQIEQVVLNLVVNARDAIDGAGTITLLTERIELSDSLQVPGFELLPGAYTRLCVSDSGRGMGTDVQARLFEPFYTTKSNGTGLGLAICYGVITQHHGAMQVLSTLGGGTTIEVFLPAQIESQTGLSSLPDSALRRGSETLLVVEDEIALRTLVERLLNSWGYRVLVAANGAEALALLEVTQGVQIDLLVTDVVMPTMGGVALAERLWGLRPDLPVLFMSGYSEQSLSDALERALRHPHASLINKPFVMTALTQALGKLLDR